MKARRFKLEVDIESEEELSLEYIRAVAESILGSNDNITAVRIFNLPPKPPQKVPLPKTPEHLVYES